MSLDLTPLFTIDAAQRVVLSIVGGLLLVTPEILAATTGAMLPQWKANVIGSLGCAFIGHVFGGFIAPLFKVKMTKKRPANTP